MTKRLYIAVEGTKGAGKSELLASLRARLRAIGIAPAPLDVTAPADPACAWERLARCSWLRRCDAFEEGLYVARARWHAERALRSTSPVILGDRSLLTSVVTRWHRTARLGVEGWVGRCRARVPQLPVPDLVLWVRVPPDLAAVRCAGRGRSYGRRCETLPAIAEADRAYALLRAAPPSALWGTRWVELDGAQSRDIVAEEAWNQISTLLDWRS